MSTVIIDLDTSEAQKKLSELKDEVDDIEDKVRGLFDLVDELLARVRAAEDGIKRGSP